MKIMLGVAHDRQIICKNANRGWLLIFPNRGGRLLAVHMFTGAALK